MKVTAIILAGGKHLRFGRVKALEVIVGKTLIERAVERLRPLSSQTLVITSAEQPDLPVPPDVKVLIDLYPGKGTMAGIYTGLEAACFSYSVVVACDMPFLNRNLLEHMINLSADFDAVIPRLAQNMVEPLHAVYSKRLAAKIKQRLESDWLSLNSFLDSAKVRYIERAECEKFDPQLLSFFNINYPSDLEKAARIAAEEKPE